MRCQEHSWADWVVCDDCEEKFCRMCDGESKTYFDEGLRFCGLCRVTFYKMLPHRKLPAGAGEAE
jgi:hypothetical protein